MEGKGGGGGGKRGGGGGGKRGGAVAGKGGGGGPMSTHNYGFLFLIDGIATAISIIIYKYFQSDQQETKDEF